MVNYESFGYDCMRLAARTTRSHSHTHTLTRPSLIICVVFKWKCIAIHKHFGVLPHQRRRRNFAFAVRMVRNGNECARAAIKTSRTTQNTRTVKTTHIINVILVRSFVFFGLCSISSVEAEAGMSSGIVCVCTLYGTPPTNEFKYKKCSSFTETAVRRCSHASRNSPHSPRFVWYLLQRPRPEALRLWLRMDGVIIYN